MRNFLLMMIVSLALIALAACGGSGETESEDEGATEDSGTSEMEEVELKVGLVVGDWSPHYKAAEAWSEALDEQSDGKVKLTIYPDGQLGGEREMMEAVQNGTLDIGLLSSVVYANFEPKMSVLEIPYLVSTFEEAEALMDGEVGEKLSELMLENGIRNLAWAHNDFRIITNNKTEITTPDDLSGVKMRVPESKILTDWFQDEGALAQQMPFPDIYTALH